MHFGRQVKKRVKAIKVTGQKRLMFIRKAEGEMN
jgi:hypothetical protein